MSNPRRRKTDRGWRFALSDRGYHDVWLIVITAIMVIALWQNAGQSKDIVDANHRACERTNILRQNQAIGLKFQINQSKQSLKGNLGPGLEPFRRQIEAQLHSREDSLRRLLVDAKDAPDQNNPYLVDCDKAHPR